MQVPGVQTWRNLTSREERFFATNQGVQQNSVSTDIKKKEAKIFRCEFWITNYICMWMMDGRYLCQCMYCNIICMLLNDGVWQKSLINWASLKAREVSTGTWSIFPGSRLQRCSMASRKLSSDSWFGVWQLTQGNGDSFAKKASIAIILFVL